MRYEINKFQEHSRDKSALKFIEKCESFKALNIVILQNYPSRFELTCNRKYPHCAQLHQGEFIAHGAHYPNY
ncbi:MAG TPA: hypothetical protein VI112_03985, partial [Bacteroidia bacterium]